LHIGNSHTPDGQPTKTRKLRRKGKGRDDLTSISKSTPVSGRKALRKQQKPCQTSPDDNEATNNINKTFEHSDASKDEPKSNELSKIKNNANSSIIDAPKADPCFGVRAYY
jgi:hypothetical protein